MAGNLKPPTRRALWWALLLAVLASHALVTEQLARRLAPIDPRLKGIDTLQAAFTRRLELAETAPVLAAPAAPSLAPAVRPARRRTKASPMPAQAASATEPKALAPATAASASESVAEAAPPDVALADPRPAEAPAMAASDVPAAALSEAASASAEAASAPASAPPQSAIAASAGDGPRRVTALPVPAGPAAAGSPEAFDWPVSTRLSYRLFGNYRGDVHGSAQVRWLREGERYQVHLDVRVGPSFAPLVSRRMSSDGLIAAEGLRPQRYEQVTKLPLQEPQPVQMQFDDAEVVLARGARVPRPGGTQDVASQFVQLIYLFRTQPGLLQPGGFVGFPLALPHRVGEWRYEVVGLQTLATPVGQVEAFHLRPMNVKPSARELSIEMWFAPRLQYLPVRLLLRQDEATWVDLTLDELPEQAAPASPAASATAN